MSIKGSVRWVAAHRAFRLQKKIFQISYWQNLPIRYNDPIRKRTVLCNSPEMPPAATGGVSILTPWELVHESPAWLTSPFSLYSQHLHEDYRISERRNMPLSINDLIVNRKPLHAANGRYNEKLVAFAFNFLLREEKSCLCVSDFLRKNLKWRFLKNQ